MSKSNFFDAIGVADMEKVHSAVIGWMLSDKCEAFDIATRSKLLQQVFGIEGAHEVFDSIESHIEWKNIDILIVTTKGSQQKCWVIENKVKSSQHSDQLNRYVQILDCPYLMSSLKYSTYFDSDAEKKEALRKEWGIKEKNNLYWAVKDKAYCFLTLIDEEPISSGNVKWKSTQYSELSGYLNSALSNADKSNSKDYSFVSEYQTCINKLGKTIAVFLKNHTQYPNVFTDGNLQKEEKILKHYNDMAGYISDNGLETIFQKCFLSSIIPNTEFGKAGRFKRISVSESHGTAFADFTYDVSGNTTVGFQFQNGTFKIQIAGTKMTNVATFLSKWENCISAEGWKVNKSKQSKKAYISLSKSINDQEPWFCWPFQKIIKAWDNAYRECWNIMSQIILPNL